MKAVPAPADAVWGVLSDVERWPTWTRSMESVQLDRPFGVGSVADIKQPRLPPSRMRVTELDPGRSFTWEGRTPGVRTVASHLVQPSAAGTSQVILTLEMTGPLAGAVRLTMGRLIQRYMTIEADGLAEAASR